MSLIQLSTFAQQNLKITILAELAVKKKPEKDTKCESLTFFRFGGSEKNWVILKRALEFF